MKASDKEDRKSAVGPKAAHQRSEKPFNRTDGPIKLNSDLVKGVPAPARGSITLWDTELGGFGIRVFAPTERHPEGARSFFLNYRVDGRECRYTIVRLLRPGLSRRRARKRRSSESASIAVRTRLPISALGARRQRCGNPIDRYLTEHLHLPVDPPGEGAVARTPPIERPAPHAGGDRRAPWKGP